jgi:hypothetical protein
MAEPDYAAERRLPEGVTCASCQHGPRCNALFGAVRRGFTSCDFWPSRFLPQPETGTPAVAPAGVPQPPAPETVHDR